MEQFILTLINDKEKKGKLMLLDKRDLKKAQSYEKWSLKGAERMLPDGFIPLEDMVSKVHRLHRSNIFKRRRRDEK